MKYLLQGQLVKLAKEINGLNPLRDMTAMVALVMAPLLPRIRAGSGKGEENMGGGAQRVTEQGHLLLQSLFSKR